MIVDVEAISCHGDIAEVAANCRNVFLHVNSEQPCSLSLSLFTVKKNSNILSFSAYIPRMLRFALPLPFVALPPHEFSIFNASLTR